MASFITMGGGMSQGDRTFVLNQSYYGYGNTASQLDRSKTFTLTKGKYLIINQLFTRYGSNPLTPTITCTDCTYRWIANMDTEWESYVLDAIEVEAEEGATITIAYSSHSTSSANPKGINILVLQEVINPNT